MKNCAKCERGISRLKKVGLKKKREEKKKQLNYFFGGLKMFSKIYTNQKNNNNKNPILTIFKRIPFHFPDHG